MKKENAEKVRELLFKNMETATCELKFENNLHLLIAVILSAQCTDKRVNIVTKPIFEKYKTAKDFVNLGQEKLEQLIKSCGFYHNKAKNIINTCKELENKYNGQVPKTLSQLKSLAGVGQKTANVVISMAYNEPALAVDTHVFRVSNRLGLVNVKTAKECEENLCKIIPKEYWSGFHYRLVLFGRYTCTARKPKCDECYLKEYCKYYKEKQK